VYWHLLNIVTPCNGAEVAQSRYSATMYKITEMDRLHEKYELRCSPLRTPEEYLVIFMCAFETKTLKIRLPCGRSLQDFAELPLFLCHFVCLRLSA
jgi:hypothetical protein